MNQRLDREKLRKYEDEVNRFEIALEERHREEQRHELRRHIEGLDRQASQEVLHWGGYENKGLVWRTVLSGVERYEFRCIDIGTRTDIVCIPYEIFMA